VFPNSQLYDDNKVIEAMRLSSSKTTGIMGAPSLSKFVKFSKQLQIFDIPFIFNNLEDVHRLADSPVAGKLVKPLESKGIKGLAFWDSGMKVFSVRGKTPLIKIPEDFKGKKFRIQTSDVHDAMIKSLGGVPQKLPFKEVYTSLSQGVVDGQENSWSNIYSKKFFEVQDYITVSNHSYLGYLVVVSSKFWDGLPKDIREELNAIITEVTVKARKFAAESDAKDIAKITAAKKAKIVELDAKNRELWKKATASVEKQFKKDIGVKILKEAKAVIASGGKVMKDKKMMDEKKMMKDKKAAN
ncbi:MAG: DctP family TRAP transporter solute-binding subunit, partial [Nitrospinota bacterium]